MTTDTVEQYFGENAADPAVLQAQLGRYRSVLWVLLGAALAMMGIAVLEFFVAPGNEVLPWMVVWLVPQFVSLGIAIHLRISMPWRKLPREKTRDTILVALGITCLSVFAISLRFRASGAPAVCSVPGLLIASGLGAAGERF